MELLKIELAQEEPSERLIEESRSTGELVESVALELFVKKGFNGASIRDIANSVPLSVAALYHYFPSKQALLHRLIDRTMVDLIAQTQEALDSAGPRSSQRLSAIVRAHTTFHMQRQKESFVVNSEMRSLVPPNLEDHIRMRDTQQRIFDDVVVEGAERGEFNVEYPMEASRAIVTMCTAVAGWYKPAGSLDEDAIAERYVRLSLAMVESRDHSNDNTEHPPIEDRREGA